MPFADFQGNADVVLTVREMLARDHFPHSVILSGPQGSGKFTLAQMVAKAMNCLQQPATDGLPDFCGVCANCTRIAEADALEERFAEAVETRENLRDADKSETRILVQTHPDVTVIPPDPPQMLVKVDQVRHVIHEIYYRPVGRPAPRVHLQRSRLHEGGGEFAAEDPGGAAGLCHHLPADRQSLGAAADDSVALHATPIVGAAAVSEVEEYLAKNRPELKPQRTCAGGAALRRRTGTGREFRSRAISGCAAGRAGAARPGAWERRSTATCSG